MTNSLFSIRPNGQPRPIRCYCVSLFGQRTWPDGVAPTSQSPFSRRPSSPLNPKPVCHSHGLSCTIGSSFLSSTSMHSSLFGIPTTFIGICNQTQLVCSRPVTGKKGYKPVGKGPGDLSEKGRQNGAILTKMHAKKLEMEKEGLLGNDLQLNGGKK
ncbi:uncharacterized protein LOC121761242 [Salvia splendens]|uniref:uncharacterized protein LOC121761242 n=1 Tax=Salvia splendens TaxID=180675 RepID=UPI001C25304F|nr:uncharacterized protein LOC121761242 [Salvia splendens]